MEHWNIGTLVWNLGLESWFGILVWKPSLDSWLGMLVWNLGLESWLEILAWNPGPIWNPGLKSWLGNWGVFPLAKEAGGILQAPLGESASETSRAGLLSG